MSAPDELVTEDPPLELDEDDFSRLENDGAAERSAYTPITSMIVPAKTKVACFFGVPITSIDGRIKTWLNWHIVLSERHAGVDAHTA